MSQTTLGDAMHLTFQQVQKYEKGSYVTDFLATSEGLALIKALSRIKDAKFRLGVLRRIVDLVEGIADQ